jgi:8-oxo-dGTP pyrophosphatase MutT (NUDIX family)
MNFKDYMGDGNFEGAGFIFMTPDNLVLILKKTNKKYSFAGGHREKGETPIETAKRECKEEIGFLPKGDIFNFIKYKRSKTNGWGYSFLMRVDEPFVPTLSNEHISYKWIPKSELKNIQLSNAVKDILPHLKNII